MDTTDIRRVLRGFPIYDDRIREVLVMCGAGRPDTRDSIPPLNSPDREPPPDVNWMIWHKADDCIGATWNNWRGQRIHICRPSGRTSFDVTFEDDEEDGTQVLFQTMNQKSVGDPTYFPDPDRTRAIIEPFLH